MIYPWDLLTDYELALSNLTVVMYDTLYMLCVSQTTSSLHVHVTVAKPIDFKAYKISGPLSLYIC